MKYIDEFNNSKVASELIERIKNLATKLEKPVRIMEICGGHTVAIRKKGIHLVLPENIMMLSGPGCPVCVTNSQYIDQAIWLANQPNYKVFTFGDMLRVPGTKGNLYESARAGKDVQMIYSPMQAVDYAKENPAEKCIFLGVGFETTAPVLAATVKMANDLKLSNFYFKSALKLTPPAMRALLDDQQVNIDGFLAPGHVTTIIGAKSYGFIDEIYHKPSVISGFELCDILDSLYLILKQLVKETSRVELQYKRSVSWDGNIKAQSILNDVFEVIDQNWRGLGLIEKSGYGLSAQYSKFDADLNLDQPTFAEAENKACRCGDVLKGICLPTDCELFGNKCQPEHAVGPCMVSSEGSCAAYWRYPTANLDN